jgi:hypothetical protein
MAEEINEVEESESKSKVTVQDFVSILFDIHTNIHIAHLQTSSYAEHKALDELYTEIVELRDRFIESYQGEYTIIKGYKSFKIQEGIDPVKYLNSKCEIIEEFRESLEIGYLQQIIDDILELIYSVKYKLRFLK